MLGLRTRFFVASTVILFACGVRAETWRLYHNERFGTTADVPADWSMNPPVDADDGRSFSSPDKRAEIAVSGLFSDTSIAEKMAIRTKPHEGETITYQKRGPRWIVVTGTSGDRIFYRKSIVTWRDSIWNDLSIEYPAAEKEKYEALVAHVGASLRGEQGDDAFVRAFRIIKEHHLLTPKMQRCSFLMVREDSTVRIWGIGVYEKHNKSVAAIQTSRPACLTSKSTCNPAPPNGIIVGVRKCALSQRCTPVTRFSAQAAREKDGAS